jgi:FixJ family two-component response regulator
VLPSRFRIAVVDDDERMCQALSRLLQVAGYAAEPHLSAEAFLSEPNHGGVQFLVADIQLRGMSGFELHERLRLEGLDIPTAFITAHDEARAREQAAAVGGVAYFRKPFPGSELIEVIQTTLGQHATGP